MDKSRTEYSRLHQWVNHIWYGKSAIAILFLPLSLLFFLLSSLRKAIYLYLPGLQTEFPVPVIIVGNITVGGSGKTPMVIELATKLSESGYVVGVASRGYGRNSNNIIKITNESSAKEVGDEPLLIFRRTNTTVVVGSDRKDNIQQLIEQYQCNLVICDDGMQDYRFKHDIEINMVDGERKFGNQYLLPAGPLRERINRLKSTDFNVVTSTPFPSLSSDFLKCHANEVIEVNNPETRTAISSWAGKRVHAVAGIANPERFFRMLEMQGITVNKHPMPDHADYSLVDLHFDDQLPVFITEKDAVKCVDIGHDNLWYIPLVVKLPETFISRVLTQLRENNGPKIT